MPSQYTLREAKARLSELLDAAAAGQSIEIVRGGSNKGHFRIVSLDGGIAARLPGALKCKISVPDTFDDENDEILEMFGITAR